MATTVTVALEKDKKELCCFTVRVRSHGFHIDFNMDPNIAQITCIGSYRRSGSQTRSSGSQVASRAKLAVPVVSSSPVAKRDLKGGSTLRCNQNLLLPMHRVQQDPQQ